MSGPFAFVAIFSCEVINGGIYGGFLLVECVPVNSSGAGRGSDLVLGWLCGLQGGEVIHINVWRGINFVSCFSDESSSILGYFQVILERIKGVFFVKNLETALTLKMKRFGVLGAKNWRKTLAGHYLGMEFLKEDFGGKMLSGEEGILYVSLADSIYVFSDPRLCHQDKGPDCRGCF